MDQLVEGTDEAGGERQHCRICAGDELTGFDAREMMFGMRDRFRYLECRCCDCVQIASYPANIEKYYPPNYFAFGDPDARASEIPITLAERLKDRALLALLLSSAGLRRRWRNSAETRWWLATRPVPVAHLYLQHVPDLRARILDVGCGTGAVLQDLYSLYYRNIHGIDPFIARDVSFAGRVLVRKARLGDLRPEYDCISLHHSLEHMPDQSGVLGEVHRLLAPGGVAIIRIPVVGGLAWRSYRENWAQLDAPRHFYLHSERSFTLLAQRVGFDVEIAYDSAGFQFWGSELYRRDIALYEAGPPAEPGPEIFPSEQRTEFARRAAALNAARDGDQIVAILRKTSARSAVARGRRWNG